MSYSPLLFTPVLKDYIWGGRNLETILRRSLPASTPIAESWEIAGHPDGDCTVLDGDYAGTTLSDLTNQLGEKLVGANGGWALELGKFPLLIKLLDAHRPLSVQVHPNDAYAQANEGNELGKAEMWVALHAEPDAEIILGVKSGANPANFRQAIDQGDLEQWLHRIPMKTGDVACVPAGSLHAILGGLLIAEIQQNSNTTYRVYDWKRLDDAGKPRQLHVDKALDVINFDQVEPQLHLPPLTWQDAGICAYLLCQNNYFVTERIEMAAGATYNDVLDGSTMEIWGVIQGDVVVEGGGEKIHIYQVRFTLLPAAMGAFRVTARNEAVLLRTYLPQP